MKVSEMIKKLQEILNKKGDLCLIDENYNSIEGVTIEEPTSRLSNLFFVKDTVAMINKF